MVGAGGAVVGGGGADVVGGDGDVVSGAAGEVVTGAAAGAEVVGVVVGAGTTAPAGLAVTTTDHLPQTSVMFPFASPGAVSSAKK